MKTFEKKEVFNPLTERGLTVFLGVFIGAVRTIEFLSCG